MTNSKDYKTISNFKKIEEEEKVKYFIEIEELTKENNLLKDKIELLQKEIEGVKTINEKAVKKGLQGYAVSSVDEYIEYYKEMFENMKGAYLNKLEEKNSVATRLKIEKRKTIKGLEENLEQETYAKQLFIKQVAEMKRKLMIES